MIDPLGIKTMVMDAIAANSMNSARTAQSLDNRLGMSELGVCRSYLQRVIMQEERREEEGIPWKAFIGTALGDALENAVTNDQELVVKQADVLVTWPSGRTTPGHIDLYQPVLWDNGPGSRIVDPGWVLDFKSKDGLVVAERGQIDRAHLYQIIGYWLALVQAGQIDRSAPAFIVYVDRTGRDSEPVVKQVVVTDELIQEADEFVGDAILAVVDGYEAQRDRPYEWCEVACPFFLNCRGAGELRADGRIEDPDVLTAMEAYIEGLRLVREGERLKDGAKPELEAHSGTNGTHVLAWTHVNSSEVAYTRRGYDKISVRPLPKPKGSK
jgi:hypothetical protein